MPVQFQTWWLAWSSESTLIKSDDFVSRFRSFSNYLGNLNYVKKISTKNKTSVSATIGSFLMCAVTDTLTPTLMSTSCPVQHYSNPFMRVNETKFIFSFHLTFIYISELEDKCNDFCCKLFQVCAAEKLKADEFGICPGNMKLHFLQNRTDFFLIIIKYPLCVLSYGC